MGQGKPQHLTSEALILYLFSASPASIEFIGNFQQVKILGSSLNKIRVLF